MKIHVKKYYFIITADVVVSWLGRLVSLGTRARAITIYPFIFVRRDSRDNEELLRHEKIHIIQQLELLLIGAVLLYVFEYFYARYYKKMNARQAYYYTALEQEAHRNAMDKEYLSQRKMYALFRYIRDKKMLARGPDGNLMVKKYS